MPIVCAAAAAPGGGWSGHPLRLEGQRDEPQPLQFACPSVLGQDMELQTAPNNWFTDVQVLNVGVSYGPGARQRTRKRHTYAAHIALNPASKSCYSSSKLTSDLHEAAVAHDFSANSCVTAKHRKTLKGNRKFKVRQQGGCAAFVLWSTKI